MGEIDAVSASNPQVVVHEPKWKVDGITKYIQDTRFRFDNTFNENENS
jgi:kinesin family protein 2/24